MTQRKKPDYHKHKVWGLRLEPIYRKAVEGLAAKTRRTATEEVRIALEEYLAKQGLWPPPPEGKSK